MDIVSYFKNVDAQKQINKLSKKYAGKKIIIYGAGEYFKILEKNYNLSQLNIVGICDNKFSTSKDLNVTNYAALTPEELKTFEYDVILVALLRDISMCEHIELEILLNTKNENKIVQPIIEPNLKYLIKVLLGIINE